MHGGEVYRTGSLTYDEAADPSYPHLVGKNNTVLVSYRAEGTTSVATEIRCPRARGGD
jgi:hypothetical protein